MSRKFPEESRSQDSMSNPNARLMFLNKIFIAALKSLLLEYGVNHNCISLTYVRKYADKKE